VKQRQSEFCVVLAEAIHEGLRNVSPSIPLAMFLYMNKKTSVRSDHYVDDPEAFDEGLKEIFG